MTVRGEQKTTVGFVALGCPKNIVDSEKMLAEIAEAGYLISAEAENADVVVINTCGFISPAKDEAIEAIERASECKRKGNVRKIIVAGCLSERLGKDLFEQVEGIDAVVGLGQRDSIAEIIEETIISTKPRVFVESCGYIISDDRARLLITPGHWAYLRISEGCDHRCSFCTIPSIRGPFRSKPLKNVLAEAAELVKAGVVELNVIAQDTTSYGRDLNIKDGLAQLVGELEQIDGLEWIRLMYLTPKGITEELIEAIASSGKIVHYFDVPIQHINDEILRAMRRRETKEQIRGLIERLREKIADSVLRTSVIVGLPGETEEKFGELIEFVEWAGFDALGCFKYYRESGTAAAEMPEQVAERIKEKRFEKLMLTQQKIAFAKNSERIGSSLRCLVDSVDGRGGGRGRFYGQAADIDSVCIIQNCTAKSGEFVDGEVVGREDYDLVIRQI
jgi:ribosomal protein S12 methylthiotransferase